MTAQRPLPAPFDRARGIKEAHSCCECEQHIAIAKRELGALAIAVRDLFGDAEAGRVVEDWIGLAEDRNVLLADGYPEWRRLTATAIKHLAERRCPRQNQQQRGE
jgi:hypothetical protein